jgi:beta-galactosidase
MRCTLNSLVQLQVWMAVVAAAAVFGLGGSAARGADDTSGPRQRLLMDANWLFKIGDTPDVGTMFDYTEPRGLSKASATDLAQETQFLSTHPDEVATNVGGNLPIVQAAFDDAAWKTVNLPHDWCNSLPFDQTADNGHGSHALGTKWNSSIGWYRRKFDLPAADAGKTMWLEFDGVYRNSLVWLNGHCLGRNLSGYASFSYDITKYAQPGKSNTLVVRVDATRTEGWFYEGAGLYRHVWLVKTDPLHVAHWGTFVTTRMDGTDATITAETTVNNDASAATCSVDSAIVDESGRQVAQLSMDGVNIEAGGRQVVKPSIKISNPQLWSVETPHMYTLVTTIKRDAKVVDEYRTPFGIRTLAWDANNGFSLNGKRVEIKGTCNHQDMAGVGSAMPDAVIDYRVKRLKEMGSNGYRMSHNPPAPEVLDACDRQGILVLDETRRFGESREALSQLTRMLLRDRNHPSIFLWSLANEESMQGSADGARIMTTMQNLAHKLDPTRLCTAAMNGAWGTGFSNVLDVQGFNYNNNGVSGFHARPEFQTKFSIGTEVSSALTTRGIYTVNGNGFESAYDENAPGWGSTAQAWWQVYSARPFVAGGFVWTGFDYRGEPTPYSWPDISSHFGIMDMCGFAKDNYYYYQVNWIDKPMVHILPHWNQPNYTGDVNVWAYANCEEVELFLNGTSLGRKPAVRTGHEAWAVPYAPGTLLCRGYIGGNVVCEDKVETTGPAVAIKLVPDRASLRADGEDVSLVTVQIVDAQGRVVPTADDDVTFTVTGGTNLGTGNGNPIDHTLDNAAHRNAFNGLAMILVQATRNAGPITVTARSGTLTTATLTIDGQAATPRPSVP